MQGDPHVTCTSAICHYNEDCDKHEACDRLNRVCRPVCGEGTCAPTAVCVADNHQPKCSIVIQPEAECILDSECPSDFICINAKCQDACLLVNVCTGDQQCRVLDTVPLRTMICECPLNTITESNGLCKKIGKLPLIRIPLSLDRVTISDRLCSIRRQPGKMPYRILRRRLLDRRVWHQCSMSALHGLRNLHLSSPLHWKPICRMFHRYYRVQLECRDSTS